MSATNLETEKSPREIAEEIVNQIAVGAWQFQSRGWTLGMIEKALRDRDERAARIIREHRESDRCEGSCWGIISLAIRGKS
jgi:hypothetical protein